VKSVLKYFTSNSVIFQQHITEKFRLAEAREFPYGACRRLFRKRGQVRKKLPADLQGALIVS